MTTKIMAAPDEQDGLFRKIDVDFLFLDLNTCTRCVGTHENLEKAIESVKQVLTLTGVKLNVNKVLIDSEEKALANHFITSPTIRVNGHDIALDTKESRCDSCTDLCGCEEGTDCRVWVYKGKEYTKAPVAMIVDALLEEVYGTTRKMGTDSGKYGSVPDNLRNFFTGQSVKSANTPSPCCTPDKQKSCCEPSEKSTCCEETSKSGECGCQ